LVCVTRKFGVFVPRQLAITTLAYNPKDLPSTNTRHVYGATNRFGLTGLLIGVVNGCPHRGETWVEPVIWNHGGRGMLLRANVSYRLLKKYLTRVDKLFRSCVALPGCHYAAITDYRRGGVSLYQPVATHIMSVG
jgi:hypothetical protein